MKQFVLLILLFFAGNAFSDNYLSEIKDRDDETDRIYATTLTKIHNIYEHGGNWIWLMDNNTGCSVWSLVNIEDSEADKSVKWSGSCVDNQAEGQGTLEYYVKGMLMEKYEGNMKEGKRYGKGVSFNTDNSERYEGEWQDGKRHGKGILYPSNGNRLEGEWKEGILSGKAAVMSDQKMVTKEYRKGFEVTEIQLKKEAEATLESDRKSKIEAKEIAELQQRNQKIKDEISKLK